MRKILFKLLMVGLLASTPFVATAADANVSSASVNITDNLAGASTSYSITVVLAAGDYTKLHVVAQEYPNGVPTESGYDFTNAAFGPVTSSTLSDSGVLEAGGVAYGYSIDADNSVGNISFDLSNVENPVDGCYVLLLTTDTTPGSGSDFTATDPYSIGEGTCDSSGDGSDTVGNATVTTLGENLVIDWDAHQLAEGGYFVAYSTDEKLAEGDETESIAVASGTYYVAKNLDVNTAYYVSVEALDSNNDSVTSPSLGLSGVTGKKKLVNKRYDKPTIKKKKIKKKKATVKWDENTSPALAKYKIEIKRNNKKQKLVKRYKNVSTSKTNKVMKSLKPGTKYKVRMKAVYDFKVASGKNAQNKWSKWKTFKTKGSSN